MQYNSYQEKIKKIANVLAKLYAFRVLIIITLSVIIVATVTACAAKGTVIADGNCPDEVTYGETLDYDAYGILSKEKYEYKAEGGEWTEKYPTEVGKYSVRAVARSFFGFKRYGEEHSFEIKGLEITPIVSSDTVMYGDEPKLSFGASLPYGDTYTCTFNYADITASLTDVWFTDLKITDKNGVDITNKNYVIKAPEIDKFEIRITERPLSITVGSSQKVYDNTPLSYDRYECGKLAWEDSIIALSNWPELINVGTEENNNAFNILNKDGQNVTNHYRISVVPGVLEVTKRVVKISTGTSSTVYNADGFRYPYYTATETDFMREQGHSLVIDTAAQITDVGTAQNIITFKVVDSRGIDVTYNYQFEQEEIGTLTVIPRKLTFTAQSGSIVYDGMEHSFTNASLTDGTSIYHHSYVPVDYLTFIDVPAPGTSYVNDHGMQVFDRNGYDVTNNYEITVLPGSVNIIKRTIVIHPSETNKTYDGQIATGTDHYCSNLASGHVSSIVWTAVTADGSTSADAGKYTARFDPNTLKIVDAYGKEIALTNYEVVYNEIEYNIWKRPITFISGSQEWMYDGQEHTLNTKESIIIDGGWGLVEGHDFGHVINASVIDCVFDQYGNIGYVENTLEEVKIYDKDYENVTKNYDVTLQSGVLIVNQRPITVQTESGSWVYDGKEHFAKNYSVVGTYGIVVGEELKCDFNVGITDFGTEQNVLSFNGVDGEVKIVSNVRSGKDVTNNYLISVNYGTLTVTRREMEIYTYDGGGVYNGTPYSNNHFGWEELNGDRGLVEGQTFDAKVYTTLTDCVYDAQGNLTGIPNSFNGYEVFYIDTDGNKVDTTNNYTFKEVIGTLTVTPRPISYKINDMVVEYGTYTFPYSITLNDLDVKDLLPGHQIELGLMGSTYDGSEFLGYPGVYYLVMDSYTISSPTGTSDVTGNYTLTATRGVLEITKRKIIFSATERVGDYGLIYDGTVPKYNDVIVGNEKLLVGHTLVLETYLSDAITGVYQSKWNGEWDILDADGFSVKDFYQQAGQYISASVEIKQRPITVAPEDVNVIYDGKEHTGESLVIGGAYGGLVSGHTASATFKGDGFILPDVYKLQIDTFTIVDADGNNVTDCYVVVDENGKPSVDGTPAFGEGNLTITPVIIHISTSDYETAWTGTGHGNNNYTIADGYESLLPEGYQIFLSEVTDAGKHKNEVVKVFDGTGKDVTELYRFEYDYIGTLWIYYPLNVRTYTESFIYNGDSQTGTRAPVINSGSAYLPTGYQFTLTSLTNVGNVSNEILSIKDAEGKDITDNYKVSYSSKGILSITTRNVIAVSENTAEGNEYVYNGRPQYFTDVTLKQYNTSTPLIEGHTAKADVNSGLLQGYTDAGTYSHKTNKNAIIIYDAYGNDVTSNYNIRSVEYGKAVIKPCTITVTPEYTEAWYTGQWISPTQKVEIDTKLGELLDAGFSYTVSINDPQIEYGEYSTYVAEFILTDASGNIVQQCDTNGENGNYILDPLEGTFVIKEMTFITIMFNSISRPYDGTPFVFSENGGKYAELTGNLPAGYEIRFNISLTNVGSITREDILYDLFYLKNFTPDNPDSEKPNYQYKGYITIYNAEGEDVTSSFEISIYEYPNETNQKILEVTKRQLTVSTASETRVYMGEGDTMYNESFYISVGSLAAGETLVVIDRTILTEPGTAYNKLTFEIQDENGDNYYTEIDPDTGERIMKSIVSNYDMTRILGSLEFKAPAESE